MINFSHLKYPPIKQKQMPRFLIFNAPHDSRYDGCKKYMAFSTEKKKFCGNMFCRPGYIFIEGEPINSMCITELYSYGKVKGTGTALLDFARTLSKKNGCGGRFHLVASTCWAPERAPHIFYRKYGMNSGNIKKDKEMDEFIKKGTYASKLDFYNLLMFYPPIKYPTPKTFKEKLRDIFYKAIDFILEK